jgi:hypothetical protein
MTGSTSNNGNELLIKYTPVLELLNEKDRTLNILYVFEHTINHILKKYSKLSIDQKTWTLVVIKNLFLDNKIHSIIDVENFVDDFILYWNKKYQKYIDDIALFSSEYCRDYEFIKTYINKKIGSI